MAFMHKCFFSKGVEDYIVIVLLVYQHRKHVMIENRLDTKLWTQQDMIAIGVFYLNLSNENWLNVVDVFIARI